MVINFQLTLNAVICLNAGDVADEGTMFVPDIEKFSNDQLQATLDANFKADSVQKILQFYPYLPGVPYLSSAGYRYGCFLPLPVPSVELPHCLNSYRSM